MWRTWGSELVTFSPGAVSNRRTSASPSGKAFQLGKWSRCRKGVASLNSIVVEEACGWPLACLRWISRNRELRGGVDIAKLLPEENGRRGLTPMYRLDKAGSVIVGRMKILGDLADQRASRSSVREDVEMVDMALLNPGRRMWLPYSTNVRVAPAGISDLVVPFIPIWFGLMVDAIVWGCLWYLAGGVLPRLVRAACGHMRMRRGLCACCGYDLSGIGDAPCPECGARRRYAKGE